MSTSVAQLIDAASRAQWEALESFAQEIYDQRVDPQHREWILLASESVQLHAAILEAVYLVERYHRRWFWRMAEATVTLLHYAVSRLFGLSLPDYSIGICQIKPSAWHRARMGSESGKANPQRTPVQDKFSLRDFMELLSTKGSIFAAAEVLSYELRNVPVRAQPSREVAEALAQNHFGFRSWPDSNWVDLADLLFLVSSVIDERTRLVKTRREYRTERDRLLTRQTR